MMIIDHPSPNFDDRGGTPIDILLLHYTGMRTATAALDRLCDAGSAVSAHYLVSEEGEVRRLVNEAARAWHAGRSFWAGATDINARSIGIEVINPGHEFGYRDFPELQIEAVVDLAQDILRRHPIPAHRVLAHSDVAPDRKTDPGEKFPWGRLADAGIGWWPHVICGRRPAFQPDAKGARELLQVIGYDVGDDERDTAKLATALRAFQRHFHPATIGTNAEGRPDKVTMEISRALARVVAPEAESLGA